MDTERHSVFVGGLPEDCEEAGLRTLFEVFGAIDDVRLIRDFATGASRCFGFIDFEERVAAANAIAGMDGKVVQGRKTLRCGWARRPRVPR